MAFKQLLGDFVLDGSKQHVPVENLDGKNVGLYFSAHWCPPCRGFTPELAKVFKNLRESKNWEIVFVSSDREEHAFDDYFAEMPWYALPYSDRQRKAQLSKKFKVRGIPTLVVLTPDGKTATLDGRAAVSRDPTGADFPWAEKPLWDVLPETLADNSGKSVSTSSLKDLDAFAFYFSAHWCPPCRAFTPKLVETYKKLKAANKKFEVVFVSGDNDPNQFKKYFAEMPWLAVDYDDDETKQTLNERYGIEGIPALVLVDAKTGQLISDNARSAVDADPEGAEFPWRPQPLSPLAMAGDAINEQPCLLAFLDGLDSDAAVDQAKTALKAVAERNAGRKTADDDEVRFFYAAKGDAMADAVRRFTGIKKSNLLLLNIPEGKKLTAVVPSFTDEAVTQFVEPFFAGTATLQGVKDAEDSRL
eukprot:TRINITY_DN14363_c0_g1_i1.p2 TRINITY_DN14363_c0_g1~~TRINITY_DN14363_c0_g1_i1.p2  ORF type:complete len:417 (-),score=158.92 TRINITY_DN14363_c0_g1_i1:98-1348(-)